MPVAGGVFKLSQRQPKNHGMAGEVRIARQVKTDTPLPGLDLRLQTKILLLLVPLVVLPILVLGWAAYDQLMDDAYNRTQRQMTTLLEQIQVQTESQLRTTRANARLFAGTEIIKRYLQGGLPAEDRQNLEIELRERLFNYQLAYPEYYEIRIVSPDGRELLRSVLGEDSNPVTAESTLHYISQTGSEPGATYTTFYRNPDNHEPVLLASKPLLFYPEGSISKASKMQLYGYLMLTVNLGFLESQVNNAEIGKFGRMFITDSTGTILFHPVGSMVGNQVPAELFDKLRAGVENGIPIAAEYEAESAHYQGIKLHDWLYVFTVFPEKELISKRVMLGRSVALITLVTILLTTSLMFGVLKVLLIRRIQQLSLAAREMGRGQVLVPIDVSSTDEIGDLAKTFREMGENLDHYHEQVNYVAYHDSLTGLPNRMMFTEYLKRATAEARSNEQELSVLFLDLDNFKRVNDTMGHQAGDLLLKMLANRLNQCVRRTDMVARSVHEDASRVVARLAGDEFIILLPRTAGAAFAQKVARRILNIFAEPFIIQQQELYISSSIGIAIFPADGENSDELLKSADVAMYHAKKLGRNNYQYYSRKLNEEAVYKLRIESKLRRAVDNNALELYYQPQMNTFTGRITGVEALLRWQDPEMGQVSPGVFVPIAEEYGLIVPISEWVIHEACRQAQVWSRTYDEPINMSINVSGIHFSGHGLEDMIASALKDHRLDPRYLELELTETAILQDPELAIKTLESLKKMGLQISLDDFGTGYSSLSYVMKLPIDKLKIDQSFIRNLERGTNGAAIVSAIIAMAHSLGISVIAEGVEEAVHLQLLREMRCDTVQGYYLARPMPAGDFERLITHGLERRA